MLQRPTSENPDQFITGPQLLSGKRLVSESQRINIRTQHTLLCISMEKIFENRQLFQGSPGVAFWTE